jgi:hypothetical protein
MAADQRAKLAAEAWALRDRQGMSVRQIADRFQKQGHQVSHMTVHRMLKEAYEQAQFLDLVGPAESRAGAIGRFDTYIEKILTAIDTGEQDFEKGMKLVLAAEQMLMKLTGSAMPSRMEVTGADGEAITPNMAVLNELRRSVDEHARRTKDMEENDGLDD